MGGLKQALSASASVTTAPMAVVFSKFLVIRLLLNKVSSPTGGYGLLVGFSPPDRGILFNLHQFGFFFKVFGVKSQNNRKMVTVTIWRGLSIFPFLKEPNCQKLVSKGARQVVNPSKTVSGTGFEGKCGCAGE
jgi:hypothetical protein